MDACARRSAPATGKVNLDFYGLGGGAASLDQKVRYSLEFSGGVAQANWQLAPKSPWAVGLRYVYADVDPKLREDSPLGGLPIEPRVKVSAPTAVLEFDTRDNLFTPTEGIYAETSYLASREALGASKDFERFEQVADGLASPAAPDHARGARELRLVVERNAVLPPALHPAAGRSGDALSGRPAWLRSRSRRAGSSPGAGAASSSAAPAPPAPIATPSTSTQNVGSGGLGFRYELASKFGMDVGIDVARSSGDDGGVSRRGQRLVPAVSRRLSPHSPKAARGITFAQLLLCQVPSATAAASCREVFTKLPCRRKRSAEAGSIINPRRKGMTRIKDRWPGSWRCLRWGSPSRVPRSGRRLPRPSRAQLRGDLGRRQPARLPRRAGHERRSRSRRVSVSRSTASRWPSAT